MSRWLPAVALGSLMALGALVVILAVRPDAAPSDAQRAEALAAELRCPDCQGLSVADSPTTSAREIRRQVDALIAGGATDDEVRAHFTARYGEWILLAPSSPVAWIAPFAAVALGMALLGWWLVGRRRSRAPEPAEPAPATLSEADRRRLHDEAEALDA